MSSKRLLTAVFGLALFAALAPADSEAAVCRPGKIADLLVTMSGRQPLVSAKINGGAVQFLADTGAFYSVITPGAAAQLRLSLHQPAITILAEGVGGSADMSATTVTLSLANNDLHHVEFLVGGGEVGSNAAGVIGQNILGLKDAEFDLANGVIRLWEFDDCGHANLAYWDKTNRYSVAPLEFREQDFRLANLTQSPMIAVYVNGVKLNAVMDTGASVSILSLAAAARVGVKPDSPGVLAGGYNSGIGRRLVQTWIAPFESFKVGDQEEIQHTKLRIGRIDLEKTDMLLGADFFLSHHVLVANSQHKVYFTYNGGPVFNLSSQPLAPGQDTDAKDVDAPPMAGEIEPTDAEGYSRRGQARLSRRDLTGALSDLSHAVELAPAEPRYLQERAVAHAANRQPFLAMQDFDAALKLKPDFTPALIARSEMRLNGRQEADALVDLDAVDRLLPKEADQRILLGQLYSRLQRYDQAITQFDLWIKAHPVDSRQSTALNNRCWARGQLGRDLQGALSDCNASLRQNRTAAALDSRGLVELRLGVYDKAIVDYDASLALSPKLAWSLYGRGLAKIKTGRTAEGQADIVSASAINPALPDLAKAHGLPTP